MFSLALVLGSVVLVAFGWALWSTMEGARAANQAKSAFLAATSHEIRTTMNGVPGSVHVLSFTKPDAEQRSTSTVVTSAGQSLLRIVDDIRDLSKIEAERLTLNPSAASVRELVENTWQIYSSYASGKGVMLQGIADPRISPSLCFDRRRLGQILNNLVSNALKFTERGSVNIEAKWIERDDDLDDIRVVVVDTGIGAEGADIDRLFQPLSQARSDTASRFGGTGLGLIISRGLAELMGGSLINKAWPVRARP